MQQAALGLSKEDVMKTLVYFFQLNHITIKRDKRDKFCFHGFFLTYL